MWNAPPQGPGGLTVVSSILLFTLNAYMDRGQVPIPVSFIPLKEYIPIVISTAASDKVLRYFCS